MQDVHGAMFTTSRMEHLEELNVSCTPPYTGIVDVKCVRGLLMRSLLGWLRLGWLKICYIAFN